MSIPQTGGGPIEHHDQLAEYLAEGCKPKEDWRIGTEHEMALSGVSLVAQEFLSQWQRNNCIVGVAEGVEEMSDIAMKRKETQKKYEKIVSHESKADAVELASNIQELLELVTDLKKNMVTKDELQDTAR